MCPGHPLGYTQHQTEAPKRLSLNFSNSNSTDWPSSKNSARPSIGLWSNISSAHPTVCFRNNRFTSQSEVANCGWGDRVEYVSVPEVVGWEAASPRILG